MSDHVSGRGLFRAWLGHPMLPVVTGTLLVLAAYFGAFLGSPPSPPRWAAGAMIAGITLTMAGVMALGARRRGRALARLGWVFAVVALVLAGCFGAALLLPPSEGPDAVLVLGLPPRAALVVLGVGLLPALMLPLAYAWTFDRQTLGPEDLERIRQAAAAAREERS